jgi:hypothetical protein
MNVETKLIKSRLGLLGLAEELGNVSLACKYLGYSRDTFYPYKELFAEGGEEALREMSRKKPNVKNRIEQEIERLIRSDATLAHQHELLCSIDGVGKKVAVKMRR